ARPAARVIWVRGEESEAVLTFAAISDLLLPLQEHFADLPSTQREALEACLALSGGQPTGPLAACAGALGVLAAVADETPLMVLVDDLQWIDPESQKILLFVARRVSAERVAMVLAVREEPGFQFAAGGLPVLRLEGLTYAECAELVGRRRDTITPAALR